MAEKKETKKTIEFNLSDVKEKPSRAYKKGSKYDSLLDSFNNSKSILVKVEMKDVNPNYLRTQLYKRIASRKMGIKTSVINDSVYLEKEVVVNLKK